MVHNEVVRLVSIVAGLLILPLDVFADDSLFVALALLAYVGYTLYLCYLMRHDSARYY